MSTFVLLHGFTGGPESFDPLVERLPGDVRVIRPALTGHGAEPHLADSWQAELQRLAELLRREEVHGAHLVGYSLGGRVGYGLLRHAPALFARATLIGANPGLRREDERAARREADAKWIELLARDGLDAFVTAWEALPMWESQRELSEAKRAAQRVLRRSHRADGLAHALRVLGLGAMPPVDPAAIPQPITLISGALDEKHVSLAKRIAPALEARLRIVPGAGHNVLLEDPDAVARELTEDCS